jgi:hypothetical protein
LPKPSLPKSQKATKTPACVEPPLKKASGTPLHRVPV